MIKSMTGFGKSEVSSKHGMFSVEIRTVNHRYFDLSSRMPNSLSLLEDRIKRYVHKYVKRGKVNFSLSHKREGRGSSSVRLDKQVIAGYYMMLKKIKKEFKLEDDIKLSHLFSFPDVIVHEHQEYDINLIWPVLESAVKSAIIDCNRMRKKEGKAIYKDLKERIGKISKSLDKITVLIPTFLSEYKSKLDSRLKEILKHRDYNIDKSRLETELAIMARQSDVSEELTRAKSHLSALKNTIASTKEAGRRLDFILQELQREINTLGSKAASIKISRVVVDVKSEIEKMREQAQNVE